MNSDGSGLTRLNIPPLWSAYIDLETGFSEVSGWIAARTSYGTWPPETFDIFLLRLPSTSPVKTISLLSPELAALAADEEQRHLWQTDDPTLALDMDGFYPTLMWSPDGRYLAFIGAMDGPSSDVYIFDSLTEQVTRLTSGPNQPVLMGWSPDSRWIVHMEVRSINLGHGLNFNPLHVWAADARGGPAQHLLASQVGYGESERILAWQSDSAFLGAKIDPFGHTSNLRRIAIDTARTETLIHEEFATAAVDPESGTLAFMPMAIPYPRGYDSRDGSGFLLKPAHESDRVAQSRHHVEGGIYLLQPSAETPRRLDYEPWEEVFGRLMWSPELQRFFAVGNRVVSFSPSGEIDLTYEEESAFPWVTADGSWLVFQGLPSPVSGGQTFRVYSVEGRLHRRIRLDSAEGMSWQAGSASLFYLSTNGLAVRLMRLDIPNGQPVLIHPDVGFDRFLGLATGPADSPGDE